MRVVKIDLVQGPSWCALSSNVRIQQIERTFPHMARFEVPIEDAGDCASIPDGLIRCDSHFPRSRIVNKQIRTDA
ncbi:MAG: hypothetical protein OEV08_16095, partial [Nitrospira sp.]|nr:hypothetical protein [Nitrospira sp.]